MIFSIQSTRPNHLCSLSPSLPSGPSAPAPTDYHPEQCLTCSSSPCLVGLDPYPPWPCTPWGGQKTTTFGGEPSCSCNSAGPSNQEFTQHRLRGPPSSPRLHRHPRSSRSGREPPHRHGIEHSINHICIDFSHYERPVLLPLPIPALLGDKPPARPPQPSTDRLTDELQPTPACRPPLPCSHQIKPIPAAPPWPREVDGDNDLPAPTTA